MKRALVLACAACGRIGFEVPGDGIGTGDDGGTADAIDEATRPNYVFVTSTDIVPSTLGGVAGGDAVCAAAASGAGLTGTYVAYLSSFAALASQHVGSAHGWVRRDGKLVIDQIGDLVVGKVFNPISIDEHGAPRIALVLTGTASNGSRGNTCGDYTSPAGSATIGISSGGGKTGHSYSVPAQCTDPLALYCFETDRTNPITLPHSIANAKRTFVTPLLQTFFPMAGGIAAADTHCMNAANNSSLGGSWKAVLPTTGIPAAARFTATNGPVVRLDNAEVAVNVGKLFANHLEAPPNQQNDQGYSDAFVWAGTTSTNCMDWTTADVTPISYGCPALAEQGFQGPATFPLPQVQTCNANMGLLCLEE